MTPPRWSILLVSWNGKHTLPACLTSLAAQKDESWELLVWDNGSYDQSAALIAGWCARHLPPERWRLIHSQSNTGYAAPMNALLGFARGEYICALNQDAVLHPGYLTALTEAFGSHPHWASVCGRVYRTADLAADTPTLLAATDLCAWGTGRTLDSTGHLLYRDRIVMNRRGGESDAGQDREPGEAFGCPGACAGYRRTALEAVRLPAGQWWNARFFAYLEDVDLDYRFRLAGWGNGYTPFAVALHQPHGSGGRARFEVRFRAHMNRYRILAQHESLASLAPDLGPLLLQECWQFLRTTLSNPLLHLSLFPFLGELLLGYWRNRHGGKTLERRWIEPGSRHGLQAAAASRR